MRKINYSDQVFINCPFDQRYNRLFYAIVFTILDCGFVPRCSLEVANATESRLLSIIALIKECNYGVHDLSRLTLDKRSQLPRFNMPFELGMYYGAKAFGQGVQQRKSCIILEKEPYRYQKFISDISGIDIIAHDNSAENLITAIRNWLKTSSKRTTIPAPEFICSQYSKFQKDFRTVCKKRGIDSRTMPFIDLTQNISDWLNINQTVCLPLFSK